MAEQELCDFTFSWGQCTLPATYYAFARHGLQARACTPHLGPMINQLWLHDQDKINVYHISQREKFSNG